MTCAIVLALTIYAATTKSNLNKNEKKADITMYSGTILVMSVALLGFAIFLIFFPIPILYGIFLIIAIIFFGIFLVYDT
jgi:heme A synthase